MRSAMALSTIMGWRNRLPANNWRVPMPCASKYSTSCCLVKGASGLTEIKYPNQEGCTFSFTVGKIR